MKVICYYENNINKLQLIKPHTYQCIGVLRKCLFSIQKEKKKDPS